MKRLLAVSRKEFTHIFRDPRFLGMSFILPVVLLLIYGFALSTDVKNIPTVIQDLDQTNLSRQLIASFTSSGYFRVKAASENDRAAAAYLLKGEATVLLKIPRDFAKKLNRNLPSPVQIIVDGSDANTATVTIGYTTAVVEKFSRNIIAEFLQKSGRSLAASGPVKNNLRIWYNPQLRSTNFLVPGLMATILMIISVLLPAMTIVGERERGTFEQLVSSPIKPAELVLGKILPFLLIGMINVLNVTLLGILVFQVPWHGSFSLLLTMAFLFLMGCFGLGIFISSVARTQQEAMLLSFLTTILPSFLLSGYIFPISSMPKIIQYFTYLVPARYFLIIVRGIFLKGVGLKYFWKEALFLLGFTVITIAAAIKFFRKDLE